MRTVMVDINKEWTPDECNQLIIQLATEFSTTIPRFAINERAKPGTFSTKYRISDRKFIWTKITLAKYLWTGVYTAHGLKLYTSKEQRLMATLHECSHMVIRSFHPVTNIGHGLAFQKAERHLLRRFGW
ncbi:MAG: hypothetical protein KAS32_24300, partial [Candidatus Peribacteraceae bacterium]|nr:hypothetical protein [Candidatus Peribacteraceae bacterium]